MFRKIVKISAIILGSLLLLTTVFYLMAYKDTQQRISKVYDISPEPITVKYDSASLQLGASGSCQGV